MSGIIGNMQSECVRSRSYESINTKARMETTFGTSAFSPVTTITRVENELDGSLNRNSASMTCVASSNSTSLGRDGDINGVVGSDQGSFDAVCFKRHHRTSSTISARSHHSISSCTEDDEEAVVLFVEEPSSKLFCILCQRVFKDPVITSCGHTFCRTCVLSRSCEKCPVDDNKLSIVVVNLAVSEQIGELYIHCKYGCKLSSTGSLTDYEVNPSGCPVTFKLSNRHEHERNCQYAPTQCPNSLHCPTLLKMDLEDHLQVCEHMRCPHQKYGCHMEGNHKEVRLHLETCKFEAVKEFLQHTDKRMEELKTMLKDKDQEIVFLKAMILKLTERVDRMEKTVDIRIDLLDESQTKLSSDLLDSRQSVSQIQTDLANVEARLWGVGTFDIQPLFKCKGTFVGHQGPVWTLCTHGEWLFSGSSDKTIKVWDTLTTYKCVKTLEGHSGIVLALCTHEKKLYSGSADCTINVWCLEELELLDSIRGHENPVCTLVTKRKMLFSGSLKKIKVWNLQTMELIQELTGLNHWVRALVASERHLFSGSYQTIKLWDLDSLECVRVLQTSGGSVYSLAVTKEYIVCGTYENQIQVYDVNTHKHLETLNGHVGTVYGLAVLSAPGQTRLFSASYDRSLRVWNLESFTCVQTLLRHQGSVAALAVTKGRIFSGAVDSTVKVWQ